MGRPLACRGNKKYMLEKLLDGAGRVSRTSPRTTRARFVLRRMSHQSVQTDFAEIAENSLVSRGQVQEPGSAFGEGRMPIEWRIGLSMGVLGHTLRARACVSFSHERDAKKESVRATIGPAAIGPARRRSGSRRRACRLCRPVPPTRGHLGTLSRPKRLAGPRLPAENPPRRAPIAKDSILARLHSYGE